jgi:hypothetical protein
MMWLLSFVLMGFVGAASAQWRVNGEVVADTAWRKAWGDHGAMLQLTDRPEELFAAWEIPAAAVATSTTEIAKRGEPIVGVVLFSGCTPNSAGVCDAEAYFQVFKPDGSPYGAEEQVEVWIGKSPPAAGQLQLSVGAMGVRIEPQDPKGTYVMRARLRDKVSQAEVVLTRTFRVES